MLVHRAKAEGAKNVSVLVSHSLVPPAFDFLLQSPQNRVQGFLGPGHVCAIMGYREYEPVSEQYKVPIVISGFEPLDLLQGTLMTVAQLEAGSSVVENQYSRILNRDGNASARELVEKVFVVSRPKVARRRHDSQQRLQARSAYAEQDAERASRCKRDRYQRVLDLHQRTHPARIKKPHDCPAFGTACTPLTPLGATMVSAEGACAAYYAYGRHFDKPKADAKVPVACRRRCIKTGAHGEARTTDG